MSTESTFRPPPGERPGDDRSVGELISAVSEDFSTLMRQEVALAKAEVRESATQAGAGAGLLAGAGVASHMGGTGRQALDSRPQRELGPSH